jgi:hypothetical protein
MLDAADIIGVSSELHSALDALLHLHATSALSVKDSFESMSLQRALHLYPAAG